MRAVVITAAIVATLGSFGCSDDVTSTGDGLTPLQRSGHQLMSDCAIYEGDLKCWDLYLGGQSPGADPVLMLRDDTDVPRPLPPLPLGTQAPVTSVADDRKGTRCAAIASEGVKCWGNNNGGVSDWTYYILGRPDPMLVLGDDPDERGEGLPFVPLGDPDVVMITTRANGYCALFGSGRVKCWGPGNASLGLGETEPRGDDPAEMGDALPYVDLGTDVEVVGISGDIGVCAWTTTGQVKCWGRNHRGQLGLPAPADPFDDDPVGDEPGEMGDALPFVDLGEDFFVVQVATGEEHACALSDAGAVKCWGANSTRRLSYPAPNEPDTGPYYAEPEDFGRLGTEDHDDRVAPLTDLPPVDLGTIGGRVVAISASYNHNCGLFENGQLKCWGSGNKLGYEDREDRGDDPGEMGDNLPFVDLGEHRVVTFAASSATTCALLDDDTVRCWGTVETDYSPGREPGTMGDNLEPLVTAEDLTGFTPDPE